MSETAAGSGVKQQPAGSGGKDQPTALERKRRRAFALAHHPDRGGDPETFIAGLAALEAGRPADTNDIPGVYRRRRGLAGWLGLGRPRPPTRTLR